MEGIQPKGYNPMDATKFYQMDAIEWILSNEYHRMYTIEWILSTQCIAAESARRAEADLKCSGRSQMHLLMARVDSISLLVLLGR